MQVLRVEPNEWDLCTYKRNPLEEERSGEPVSQKRALPVLYLVVAASPYYDKVVTKASRKALFGFTAPEGHTPSWRRKRGSRQGRRGGRAHNHPVRWSYHPSSVYETKGLRSSASLRQTLS